MLIHGIIFSSLPIAYHVRKYRIFGFDGYSPDRVGQKGCQMVPEDIVK